MLPPEDYIELALTSTREEFVSGSPYFFLVSTATLVKPTRPQRTGVFELTGNAAVDKLDSAEGGESSPIVLAVRKIKDTFPSMITLGRTLNNDIVLLDVGISRFHAFFRTNDKRIELADAGSRNGTWIAGVKLEPKGPAMPVESGSAVRFAQHEFSLFDAARCWDQVRRTLGD